MRAALSIFILLFIVQMASMMSSCSLFPQFNESGKTSAMKCIYLTTDSLILHYECRDDAIEGFTILNRSSTDPDSSTCSKKFDVPVVRYRLPIIRESIVDKSIEIMLKITDSHHREGFSIYIKPGDLNKYKKLYCSYSPL